MLDRLQARNATTESSASRASIAITGKEKDLYDVVADEAANHLRNLAINELKAANPELQVSFTIATQPNGLPHDPSYVGGDVLGILEQAKADHVDLDVVNIMAMDYFSGIKHPDMGQLAIEAAKATHMQLIKLGMDDVKIAITPMIGQNDNWQNPKTSEVFTLQDARQVTAFAARTDWVAGIGMWELPRDMAATHDTTNHQPTSHKSGVIQDQWEFSSIFDQLSQGAPGERHDQFHLSRDFGTETVEGVGNLSHGHNGIGGGHSVSGDWM